MLKLIEDIRGNLDLVPVPGDWLEEQRAMTALMEAMAKIGPDTLLKASDPKFVESLESLKG